MTKTIKELFPNQFKTRGYTLRKPVTISLKADLLSKYKEYCKRRGMFLSRRIEVLIRKDLEKHSSQEARQSGKNNS